MKGDDYLLIIVLGLVVLLLMAGSFRMRNDIALLQQRVERTERKCKTVELEVKKVEGEVRTSSELIEEVKDSVNSWGIDEFEVTGYAPLDPNAVEGMCYAGDPNITASGEQVVPGVTVAAGKEIPFGTRLYIEGLGWREVQDRGGMIGSRSLDVAFSSKGEALRFGRKTLKVMIPKEE